MQGVVNGKRGQLTIFIIIAVIVFIGIVIYFTLGSNLTNGIGGSSVVDDAISECVTFMVDSSYKFVTYQGGYSTPPEKFFNFSPTFFPYYYYEGKSLIPSLTEFEDEMGNFVEENLADCFDSIESAGFDVLYDEIVVDVAIDEDGVEYEVDTSVTLNREGQSMRVDVDETRYYESKLYYLYEAASFFVADQVEDPEFYCISCITAMAEQRGFKFYIFPLVEDVYFVMIFTNDDDPLILNFVNKYKPGATDGQDTIF
jgi:hypothetical protein